MTAKHRSHQEDPARDIARSVLEDVIGPLPQTHRKDQQ